jgi:hypothetical protein
MVPTGPAFEMALQSAWLNDTHLDEEMMACSNEALTSEYPDRSSSGKRALYKHVGALGWCRELVNESCIQLCILILEHKDVVYKHYKNA